MPSSLKSLKHAFLRLLLLGLLSTNLGLVWAGASLAQSQSRANSSSAEQLQQQFNQRVAAHNRRIVQAQDELQALLNNPRATDDQIRNKQRELSALRTQREEMATAHLLRLRRLQGSP
ncbi:hypothetical protein [Leptolyngbya sp. FACHB-261]|uniref:hypothetical protein n=1 Tax=Leptolyngbya sp. FACHB-261 TaxID=2692806 RepID=UPI00168393F2|nr:hypothetical protein [Leptolyngbya sp. FACHB-261]MBD2105000.1 hypothetical protein [Leptolyngbya sp. FACHB-261]